MTPVAVNHDECIEPGLLTMLVTPCGDLPTEKGLRACGVRQARAYGYFDAIPNEEDTKFDAKGKRVPVNIENLSKKETSALNSRHREWRLNVDQIRRQCEPRTPSKLPASLVLMYLVLECVNGLTHGDQILVVRFT